MPSRRSAIAFTPEEQDAFLKDGWTIQIASMGPKGYPHLVAMWYGFLDGDLAFETFEKSQKVQNLRRDPRITVLVEDGDQYEDLRGVELVGPDGPEAVMSGLGRVDAPASPELAR